MSTELKAGDTITAESLNGIAEGAYTFKSGEILTASKLNTIAEAIEDKDEEIAELEGQVEELQAIIDAFPTIESLNVTQNGIYQEAGKAYTPVDVSVSSVAVEALSVTANGTYSESGKAFSPVTVNVAGGYEALSLRMTVVNNTGNVLHIPYIAFYETANEVITSIDYTNTVDGGVASLSYNLPKSNNKSKVILQLRGTGGGRTINVTTGAAGVTVTPNINYIDITIDLATYIDNSLIALTIS